MLDVCLEVYGMAVHVVERGLLDSTLAWRRRRPGVQDVTPPSPHEIAEVHEALDTVAGSMSTDEVRALWLVDVCGCRYVEAAAEMRTDANSVARHVAEARRRIRAELV